MEREGWKKKGPRFTTRTLRQTLAPSPPFAGLGGARIKAARENSSNPESAVVFWEAVTAIESLLWLADLSGLSWFTFRVFKGPSTANAAESLPR
jgi:hypothetical protein